MWITSGYTTKSHVPKIADSVCLGDDVRSDEVMKKSSRWFWILLWVLLPSVALGN